MSKIDVLFRIADLRKKAGMSQAELAQRMGYRSSATIAMWETGDRKPPSDVLPALAKELGCTIQDLYRCTQEEPA